MDRLRVLTISGRVLQQLLEEVEVAVEAGEPARAVPFVTTGSLVEIIEAIAPSGVLADCRVEDGEGWCQSYRHGTFVRFPSEMATVFRLALPRCVDPLPSSLAGHQVPRVPVNVGLVPLGLEGLDGAGVGNLEGHGERLEA